MMGNCFSRTTVGDVLRCERTIREELEVQQYQKQLKTRRNHSFPVPTLNETAQSALLMRPFVRFVWNRRKSTRDDETVKLLPKLVGFFPGDVSEIFELLYLAFTYAQVNETGHLALPAPCFTVQTLSSLNLRLNTGSALKLLEFTREKIIVNGETHYRAINVDGCG